MRKNLFFFKSICNFFIAALLSGCAGLSTWTGPNEQNFILPAVTLSHVEVEHYYGYWYFANNVKPTRGEPGNYGAPLDMAFIFDIENTNPYPVLMEDFKFSVYFEEFEVNTVKSAETMWIPPDKTNQVRVHALFDTHQTLLNLILPGAMKLREKKMSSWEALEKWWTGAPDFSFPVHVREGAAVFKADSFVKVAPFEATFP